MDFRIWLPLVVPVAARAVLFATVKLVSDTWADLVDLRFLIASPFYIG